MRLASRLLAGIAVLTLFFPRAILSAQVEPGSVRRGWATLGVGVGVGPSDGAAMVAGGSYSAGRAVATVRFDATGPWYGDQVRGKAVLIGVRSRGPSWFALIAGGVARTHALWTCECGTTDYGRATVLAFEAKGFHDFEYAASSLSVYATVGPRRHRYMAVTLSRDSGWVGAEESVR